MTSLIKAEPPTLMRPIASVEQLVAQRQEIVTVLPKVLQRGVDVITIPGTGDKEALSKAGAERCAIIFGCHPEYDIVEKEVDHERVNTLRTPWVDSDLKPNKEEAERLKRAKQGRWKKNADGDFMWQVRGEGTTTSVGLYRYVVRARVVRQDGVVVGDCIGSCSTMETKYIDRPRDCENTVLKMAQKRAFVGAVLNAFGLSDRFAVDDEASRGDDDAIDDPDEKPAKAPPPKRAPPGPALDVPRVMALAAAIVVADAEGLATLTDDIAVVCASTATESVTFAAALRGLIDQRAHELEGRTWAGDEKTAKLVSQLRAKLGGAQ